MKTILSIIPPSEAFWMMYEPVLRTYLTKVNHNIAFYVFDHYTIKMIEIRKSRIDQKDLNFGFEGYHALLSDIKPRVIHILDVMDQQLIDSLMNYEEKHSSVKIIYSPHYSLLTDIFLDIANSKKTYYKRLEDLVDSNYSYINGIKQIITKNNLMNVIQYYDTFKTESLAKDFFNFKPQFDYIYDLFNNNFNDSISKSKKRFKLEKLLDKFTNIIPSHLYKIDIDFIRNFNLNTNLFYLPNHFIIYLFSKSKYNKIIRSVKQFKQAIDCSKDDFLIGILANKSIFKQTLNEISHLLFDHDNVKIYYYMYDGSNLNSLYNYISKKRLNNRILIFNQQWNLDEVAKSVAFPDILILPVTIDYHKDYFVFDLFAKAAISLKTPIVVSYADIFKEYDFAPKFKTFNYFTFSKIFNYDKEFILDIKDKEINYVKKSDFLSKYALSKTIKKLKKLYH